VSLALGTRRRQFTLQQDFQISVAGFDDARLNGTLTVPAKRPDGRPYLFDGASIPVPWLVAALSGNVLRPLGTVLIPSIVHDYLFETGEIEINGSTNPVKVDRNTADRLFLKMFWTVSGMRVMPFIAWLAIRIGAIRTQYPNESRQLNEAWIVLGLICVVLVNINVTLFWSLAGLLIVGLLIDLWLDKIAQPYQRKI